MITQLGRDPLLEAMPIGYMALDHQWRVTYINAAGEAVVGAGWDELVGADYWAAFPANVENEFGRVYREVGGHRPAADRRGVLPRPAEPVVRGAGGARRERALARLHRGHRTPSGPGPAGHARPGQRRAGRARSTPTTQSRRIPGIVVPALGEGCLITVVDNDGRPQAVELLARRPGAPRGADALLRAAAGLPGGATRRSAVAARRDRHACPGRGGRPPCPTGEPRRPPPARSTPGRVLTIPLRGREPHRRRRSPSCSSRAPARTSRRCPTAQDVADRVGLALDNVRLFSQQRQVAEVLQRSLLTAPFEPRSCRRRRPLPAGRRGRPGRR